MAAPTRKGATSAAVRRATSEWDRGKAARGPQQQQSAAMPLSSELRDGSVGT